MYKTTSQVAKKSFLQFFQIRKFTFSLLLLLFCFVSLEADDNYGDSFVNDCPFIEIENSQCVESIEESMNANLISAWYGIPTDPFFCETHEVYLSIGNFGTENIFDIIPQITLPYGMSHIYNWEVAYPGGPFGQFVSIGIPDIVNGNTYSYSDPSLWSDFIAQNGLPGIPQTGTWDPTLTTVTFKFGVTTNCDEFTSGSKLLSGILSTDPMGTGQLSSAVVESPGYYIQNAGQSGVADLLVVSNPPQELNCSNSPCDFEFIILNVSEIGAVGNQTCFNVPHEITYIPNSVAVTIPPNYNNDNNYELIFPTLNGTRVCFGTPDIGVGQAFAFGFQGNFQGQNPQTFDIDLEVASLENVSCVPGPPEECDVYVKNNLLGQAEITFIEACDDLDGDGYSAIWCGGNDCDDNDPDIFPGNMVSSGNEWIESIELAGAFHQTGNSGGYGDYSASSDIQLSLGNAHEMVLTPGYGGAPENIYWRVYVDYNQNGIFEHGGEREIQVVGSGPQLESLLVPANALEGTTKMRVIMSKGGYKLPCQPDFDGEVEDYTLSINLCEALTDGGAIGNGQAICASNNDPSPISNDADANGNVVSIEYQWFSNTSMCEVPEEGLSNGWLEIAGATGASYDPGPLTASSLYIRGARNVGCQNYVYSNIIEMVNTVDCTPDCASAASANPDMWIKRVKLGNMANNSGDDGGYADNSALVSTVTQGKRITHQLRQGFSDGASEMHWRVWVDWNQDGYYSDLCELMIEKVSSNTVNGNFYVPVDALVGNTTFRVAMKSGGFPEPCETGFDGEVEDYSMLVEASASPFADGSENNAFQVIEYYSSDDEINVYPNPASDVLNIDVFGAYIGSTLILKNSIGKRFYENPIGDEQYIELNTSEYVPGLYFIVIESEKNSVVKKVLIH